MTHNAPDELWKALFRHMGLQIKREHYKHNGSDSKGQ